MRVWIALVLLLFGGAAYAGESCDSAACTEWRARMCLGRPASCVAKQEQRCPRLGAWKACRSKPQRATECDAGCATAYAAFCGPGAKPGCRRTIKRECLRFGPLVQACTVTTTTTTVTTSTTTTTAPRIDWYYGGEATFIGSLTYDSCGDSAARLGDVLTIQHAPGRASITAVAGSVVLTGTADAQGFTIEDFDQGAYCSSRTTIHATRSTATTMTATVSIATNCPILSCLAIYTGTLSY